MLIGHKGARQEVKETLRNPANQIVAIEGIPGIGKTAFALDLVRDYINTPATHPDTDSPDEDHFDAIFYFTARHQTGTPTALTPPTFTTVGDIYGAIAQVYNVVVPGGVSSDPTRNEIRDALNDFGRVLLVLDDLNDLDAVAASNIEHDLLNPANALAPTCQILVTMRMDPQSAAWPVRIPSLTFREMNILLWRTAKAQEITLSAAERRQLAWASRGLPQAGMLGLTWASDPHTGVAGAARLTDEFFAQTVDATLTQLKTTYPESFDVLVALSFFDQRVGATKEQLCAVLDLKNSLGEYDVRRLDERLHPLWTQNLAYPHTVFVDQDVQAKGYIMTTTIQERIEASSFAVADGDSARDRWVDWYLAWAQAYGGKDGLGWARKYRWLEVEWPTLLRVFNWCRAHGQYDKLRQFWLGDEDGIGSVDYFADLYGHWRDRWAWLLWLAYAAHPQVDWPAALTAFSNAGWMRSHQGDPFQAYDLLHQAAEYCRRGNLLLSPIRLELLENLAEYFIRKGTYESDPDSQARLYEQARSHLDEHETLCADLRAAAQPGPQDTVIRRAEVNRFYYRAIIYTKTNDLPQAARLFREVELEAKSIHYERGSLYARNWLADIAILEGRLDDARALLDEVEVIARANRDARRTAYAAKSRGMLLYKMSESSMSRELVSRELVASARRIWQNAILYFIRLDMKREAAEVRQLLNQLAP